MTRCPSCWSTGKFGCSGGLPFVFSSSLGSPVDTCTASVYGRLEDVHTYATFSGDARVDVGTDCPTRSNDGIMRASDGWRCERRARWWADPSLWAGLRFLSWLVLVCSSPCVPICAGSAPWCADTPMWARVAVCSRRSRAEVCAACDPHQRPREGSVG